MADKNRISMTVDTKTTAKIRRVIRELELFETDTEFVKKAIRMRLHTLGVKHE